MQIEEFEENMKKLQKTLDSEKVKKVEAINKLTQVMFSRPPTSRTGRSTAEPRRQDREIRKLRHELQRETEKFNNLVAKYHKDLEDVQIVCLCVYVCVYVCMHVFNKSYINRAWSPQCNQFIHIENFEIP